MNAQPPRKAAHPAGHSAAGANLVRVIVAEDSFLRAEAIETYRHQAAAPPSGDWNAERFDLGREQLEPLLDAARTVPMMAKSRWVHGDNLDALPAKAHPALLAYCSAPAPQTVLLLSAHKLDGRWKLSQALRGMGVVHEVVVPKLRDLPLWIRDRARGRGLRLEGAAAAALAGRVGPHFGVLAAAIDTLISFAGNAPDAALTAADVEALVAPTREAHVFELTAAFGRRDWPAASAILHALLDGGESPLLVLTMLARQIRLLLAAKRWRGPARDLAESAGVRPFVAEGLLQDARHVSEVQLLNALRAAQACDVALKSSTLPPHLALERLLWTAM